MISIAPQYLCEILAELMGKGSCGGKAGSGWRLSPLGISGASRSRFFMIGRIESRDQFHFAAKHLGERSARSSNRQRIVSASREQSATMRTALSPISQRRLRTRPE